MIAAGPEILAFFLQLPIELDSRSD
jgi:hypothetical protein